MYDFAARVDLPKREVYRELAMAAEALTAATATAAEMLGLNAGSIQVNNVANFIAFEKDPLQDLNHLKSRSLVVSRGHIICKNLNECQL